MTIRHKTIIIFGVSFALLIGAVIYATDFFVKKNFVALENRNAYHAMELFQQELKHRLKSLHLTTLDWSIWDPTYQFASTLDNTYVTANMSTYFLNYSEINFVIILDSSGKVVFTLFHEQLDEIISVEELIEPRLEKFPVIFKHLLGSSPKQIDSTGFITIGQHPAVVSGHQLLKADLSGPSRGVLIMGSILYADSFLSPSKNTQLEASITKSPQQTLETPILPIGDISPFSPEISIERTSQHISTKVILSCLDKQQLLLTVTDTRDLFLANRQTTYYYNTAIIVLGLVFGLTSLLFMERVVLTPLTRFTRSVLKMGRGEYCQVCLSGQSSDEVGQLAGSINKMLETLADYQLEKDARQFQDLVESSLVSTLIVVRDRIVYQSPVQREICGDLPDHFSIYNFMALNVDPKDRYDFLQAYNSVKSNSETPVDIECRVFKFDESYQHEPEEKWLHQRLKATAYQGDSAVIINSLDATNYKRLEETLRVREKMVSLGNVAAGIAHEIRNPLSAIAIMIDSLLPNSDEFEDGAEVHDLLMRARQDVQHISAVIKRVLDFARPSQPCLMPLNINTAIENVAQLTRASLRQKNTELTIDADKDIRKILLNRQLIEELLMNLIENATQAMEGQQFSKKIHIVSRYKHGEVVLNISDSGPGLSHTDESQIFQPFYTTKKDGSGIGLNICQRIVIDHGGSIKLVHSRLGGAEFQITFSGHLVDDDQK